MSADTPSSSPGSQLNRGGSGLPANKCIGAGAQAEGLWSQYQGKSMLCCTHAAKMPLQQSHHEEQRLASCCQPPHFNSCTAPPLAHRWAAWSLGPAARQRTGESWPAWPSGACSVSTAAPWRPASMGVGLHQTVRQLPQALPRETQRDPRFCLLHADSSYNL